MYLHNDSFIESYVVCTHSFKIVGWLTLGHEAKIYNESIHFVIVCSSIASLQKTCIYCGFPCHIRCKKCVNPACGKDLRLQSECPVSPSKLYRKNPGNTWKLLRNKVCVQSKHEWIHMGICAHTYMYLLPFPCLCRPKSYTTQLIWTFLFLHTNPTPFETAPVCLQLMA